MTANAAKDIDKVYISAVANGSFTIAHHNISHNDVTFRYMWAG
jgi:hypothetical protein